MNPLPFYFQRKENAWVCPTTHDFYKVSYAIDTKLSEKIESNFGIQNVVVKNENHQILLKPEQIHDLSKVGIVMEKNLIRVDYAGIAQNSATVLAPITKNLLNQVRYTKNLRHCVAAVAGLAQSLNYDVPDNYDKNTYKLGFRTPLEVLVKGSGDCDSRVCLAASMLKSVNLAQMVQVNIKGHSLLGVKLPIQSGDFSLIFELEQYVLIECTNLLPIGSCDLNSVSNVKSYSVFKL